MDEEVELEESVAERPPFKRRRRRRNPVTDLLLPATAIAVVVIAIVAIELYRERSTGQSRATSTGAFSPIDTGLTGGGSPKVGKVPPAFELLDHLGNPIRLDQFRGRPVILNFWATWCVPCRREIPDFIDAQETWGETAQILGVDYGESADAVSDFATIFAVNYPLLLDTDGSVTEAYRLTGLPETFFIDANGVVADHRIGQLRPALMECIVGQLLQGSHQPEECR